MRRWWIGGRCDGNGHTLMRVTFFGEAFGYTDDILGVTLSNIKANTC